MTIPLAVLIASAAATLAAAPPQPSVNPDAQVQVEFDKRVKDYAALHEKLEATLPALPTEATREQIDAHSHNLSMLLQRARPRARQGDFFQKETRSLFRRLLARVLSGPDGQKAYDALMEDNPGPLKLQINGQYPDPAPRSTVPAQVLQNLPRLPEKLEYRFLGRRLILIDGHARIVLDYIEDALPKHFR
jgi:hypothetical protein